MNAMNDEKTRPEKCSGCGIKLQSVDKELPGYIPEVAFGREPVICQRCFRIKNYNEASSVSVNQDEFLKLLSGVGEKNALVIHIVDLFDFEGSLISGLQRFVGNNQVILAVNKIDLLPKVTNWNRLRNWMQQRCKEEGCARRRSSWSARSAIRASTVCWRPLPRCAASVMYMSSGLPM